MAKAKYTYYYNGEVARQSNKVYKYGLANKDNKIIACSINKNTLEKQKEQAITSRQNALNYFIKTNDEKYITSAKEEVEQAKKWFIVELEQKEN